jgi:hypothetical protein
MATLLKRVNQYLTLLAGDYSVDLGAVEMITATKR